MSQLWQYDLDPSRGLVYGVIIGLSMWACALVVALLVC